jgi:hypothetical protein
MRGLLKLSQGSETPRPANGARLKSAFEKSKRAFRRYLLISTGISSTAVGLALIVSFAAATIGGSGHHLSVAEGSTVEVSPRGEHANSDYLESTRPLVASELSPNTVVYPAASPAPPFRLDAAVEASPPAADLDAPEAIASADLAPQPAPEALGLSATPEPNPLAVVASQEIPAAEPPQTKTPEENQIAPPGGLPSVGEIYEVNVTFYDCLNQGFCGAMYSGVQVFEGAAACSWDLPLGTRFVIEDDPTRRIYVCADRGLLPDTWVDIYFYSPSDGWAWQGSVGRHATLLILSVPDA